MHIRERAKLQNVIPLLTDWSATVNDGGRNGGDGGGEGGDGGGCGGGCGG